MSYTVAALYRFVRLSDLASLRRDLLELCEAHGVCGTLLIAEEGINGTIAAAGADLDPVIETLDRRLGIRQGELKFSRADDRPFGRLKVRIRPEIITMRAPEADPAVRVGTHVAPADWNALIADPEVLVLDTRNAYETLVGSFRGAVDPCIGSFTEFKDYVDRALDPARHRKVAMFCTGGIRCEKASAFMLARGFESVFHLKGGILQYLEDVPAEESLWEGDCFVFDNRVAVGHGLEEGAWDRCFGCGYPLTAEDLSQPSFEAGVSCRHCIDRLTPDKARSLRARHRQIEAREAGDDASELDGEAAA
ncbi:oxygen-dependent tRNA uridine(34) hydroxylase TrhO [Mangrovibrevibacter kandeliae]|uniref:oxygen-dependent tRNA uridine(34) hydroxylase TrhO n=1 Tax=Mangrovibrevibacter kandeliae TaxID=2968473 RepID=UPI002117F8E9|nr:rhodanese-related sulfurtransferase [Aurantimonas sp. CSK15Z-1]MCQ8784080.1 rhodanese-related sulfurtransferase [Aurantimonas sp. CSK15Z-1]